MFVPPIDRCVDWWVVSTCPPKGGSGHGRQREQQKAFWVHVIVMVLRIADWSLDRFVDGLDKSTKARKPASGAKGFPKSLQGATHHPPSPTRRGEERGEERGGKGGGEGRKEEVRGREKRKKGRGEARMRGGEAMRGGEKK